VSLTAQKVNGGQGPFPAVHQTRVFRPDLPDTQAAVFPVLTS
jgi:hypothetical protein